MNKKWLKKGPKVGELVSEIVDKRKKKNKVALVIPTYQNAKVLEEHLKRLKNQSFKDFDIIIVYGEKDKFLPVPGWAEVVQIREKGKNGSAGAYYIGEKYAVEMKYDIIVLADDDCYPESDDLLENLVKKGKNGNNLVLPLLIQPNHREISKHYEIHFYGCMKRKLLEQTGLTFMPLYFGGEDIELIERIERKGFSVEEIESIVSHKRITPPLIKDGSVRRYYYVRGGFEAMVLVGNYVQAFLGAFFYLCGSAVFWILGKKNLPEFFVRGIFDGSRMVFFDIDLKEKESLKTMENDLKKEDMDFIVDIRNNKKEDFSNLGDFSPAKGQNLYLRSLKWFRRLISYFADSIKFIGKKLLFVETIEPIHTLFMLMAKNSYTIYQKKSYQLYKDRGTAQIIMGIVCFGFVVPWIAIISVFLVILGILNKKIRKITTEGYGIDF